MGIPPLDHQAGLGWILFAWNLRAEVPPETSNGLGIKGAIQTGFFSKLLFHVKQMLVT